MGCCAALHLSVMRVDEELNIDERKEILNRINVSNIGRLLLTNLLLNENVMYMQSSQSQLVIFKDKFMCDLSLTCPELSFRLSDGKEWSETWINGMIIESIKNHPKIVYNKLQLENTQVQGNSSFTSESKGYMMFDVKRISGRVFRRDISDIIVDIVDNTKVHQRVFPGTKEPIIIDII